MTPRRPHTNILTIALALKEPVQADWIDRTKVHSGTDLRVTEDTALVARLRAQRLADVLQAPQRGRQPATGRPKYILKLYPNADGPVAIVKARKLGKLRFAENGAAFKKIPFFLLASLAQAAVSEWTKQRSNFARQVEEDISSLEARLLSTRDRNEKKRLADSLQTALHADENVDAEVAKRVYAKLANSAESYSDFVDAIDWTALRVKS